MRIALALACLVFTVHAAERVSIAGKVVDAAGSPVEDATVLVYKAGAKTGYSTYCPTCYVDCGKHTLTGADGKFQLNGLSPDLLFTILVIHRGHATSTVDRVDPEKGTPEPVSNAEVGLMSHSNRSGTSYPEVRIGTQEDGTFAVTNVPAGRIWVAYPKMESLAQRGLAGRPVDLETKDNGEDVNLGDIDLTPAYTLRGQVNLTDGKPVPAGMRITLGADRAWDSQTALLPTDGKFEFRGLAAGVYAINPALKGYELTEGFEQEALVHRDTTVTIRMRPRQSR